MDNQMTYFLIGGIGHIILWMSYKKLKQKKTYLTLLTLTVILATFGFLNIDNQELKMENGTAAAWAFIPLFFMIFYWFIRQIFIMKFHNKPLMTGYFKSSWNQGEYRRLHIGDALFTILTLILPMLAMFLI